MLVAGFNTHDNTCGEVSLSSLYGYLCVTPKHGLLSISIKGTEVVMAPGSLSTSIKGTRASDGTW